MKLQHVFPFNLKQELKGFLWKDEQMSGHVHCLLIISSSTFYHRHLLISAYKFKATIRWSHVFSRDVLFLSIRALYFRKVATGPNLQHFLSMTCD